MKTRALKPMVGGLAAAIVIAAFPASAQAETMPDLRVWPQTFSATEGLAANNVTVATFTDPAGDADITNYSATIDWGDGTPTDSGVVAAQGDSGFDVIGAHTYADHGTYLMVVAVTAADGRSGATNNLVNVRDALLTAAGRTLSAIEGLEFSATVASFTDANPFGVAEDFSASIAWGDGETTPGAVVTNDAGGFEVIGTHAYWNQGSFAIIVDIADVGGSTATAGSTANVMDAPLVAAGLTIAPVEGTAFTGVVATFSDPDVRSTASEFDALIDWGDGSRPTGGHISATGPGSFEVSGTHTYWDEGAYTVMITILEPHDVSLLAGLEPVEDWLARAAGTANVGDAPLTTAGVTIAAIEGSSFTAVMATFADANTNTTADEYSALIDWGDGEVAWGEVSVNDGGGFKITGSHCYKREGPFGVSITVYDQGGSGASAGSTVNVADAELTAGGVTLAPVEGAPFSETVATFTDANPFSTADDFTVEIEWGDGETSGGTVLAVDGGGFKVVGSHTYAEHGSYGITVSISDEGGNGAQAGSTATVADAPLTAVGRLITPIENAAFVAVVASFVDANPFSNLADYFATIYWGDGVASSGTVVPNGAEGYAVMGSHTYAKQGLYFLWVTVQDIGGATVSVESMADTSDAPMIGFGTTLSAVQGVKFTNVVASCIDTDLTPEAEEDYHCIIDWGDGCKSEGWITEDEEEIYYVAGSHTYAEPGSYVILVTIDNLADFVSTTARSTALVSEPCAQDVTSMVAIKATRPRLNKRTGLIKQVLSLKNVSGQVITGPVCVVLDDLGNGGGAITLFNKDGETASPCSTPGSPCKDVILPKGNVFRPRAHRSVTLYYQSSSTSVTHHCRVLAGPGAR